MGKAVKIIAIGLAVIVGITLIAMIFSGKAQDSFQQGMDSAKNTVQEGAK